MKYLNGVLRAEQDSTLRLKRVTLKRKLSWLEYIPLILLGVLLAGLLVKIVFS
jgi:hypothetical protein